MDDTLHRIAAAVTPAVMVSACGMIALGLDNQAGRLTTRMRDLAREFRSLEPQSARLDMIKRQVRFLGRRHGILTWALSVTYGAMFSFLLTSLLYLAQVVSEIPDTLPLLSFTLGVGLLGLVSLLVLGSLRLSRAAILLEQGEILGEES